MLLSNVSKAQPQEGRPFLQIKDHPEALHHLGLCWMILRHDQRRKGGKPSLNLLPKFMGRHMRKPLHHSLLYREKGAPVPPKMLVSR